MTGDAAGDGDDRRYGRQLQHDRQRHRAVETDVDIVLLKGTEAGQLRFQPSTDQEAGSGIGSAPPGRRPADYELPAKPDS